MYKEENEEDDVYEPVVESADSGKDDLQSALNAVLAKCKGDHRDGNVESKVTSWKQLQLRRRRIILYLLSDVWITVRRWLFPTAQYGLVSIV